MIPARWRRVVDASPVERRRLLLRSLVVWGVLGALAWLDRDRHVQANQAAVFAFIVSAIGWIVDVLATAAAATVTYLATVVSYIAKILWGFLADSGAMFAKVWDGIKVVWSDAVKPFLGWLHDMYDRVKDWMVRTFGPIIKWAERLREGFIDVYNRFVKPIVDALNTIKAVLDMLAKLHVPFAQRLEDFVDEVERAIVDNYLKLLGYINKIIDTLNGYFTLDGLLQRQLHLRTAMRDVFYLWRVAENSRWRPNTDAELEAIKRSSETADAQQGVTDTGDFWSDVQNDATAPMFAAVKETVDELWSA
jgi:hypothetical protein